MRDFSTYRGADPSYTWSNAQLASVFMRAGKFFAVLCICLGIISGAIIPGPPEQRIFNVFFFGLIPALAFRVSGPV
jgi:hypothetical protein